MEEKEKLMKEFLIGTGVYIIIRIGMLIL